MDSLCHPWLTTTNLSYRFPIFETSATALCGTTGTIIAVRYSIHRCSLELPHGARGRLWWTATLLRQSLLFRRDSFPVNCQRPHVGSSSGLFGGNRNLLGSSLSPLCGFLQLRTVECDDRMGPSPPTFLDVWSWNLLAVPSSHQSKNHATWIIICPNCGGIPLTYKSQASCWTQSDFHMSSNSTPRKQAPPQSWDWCAGGWSHFWLLAEFLEWKGYSEPSCFL